MPKKVVAKFEVSYLQVLDENGKVDTKLMPKISKKDIKDIYKNMILTRVFDDRLLKLQREGRLGTLALSTGQEAISVVSAHLCKEKDWIVPSFREQGAYLTKGLSAHQMFQYWGGDERSHKYSKDLRITPISIPVGSHPLHAVGIAYASKFRKEKSVALSLCGDGATSTGDFNEAINFAGVLKVPVVFIIQNNQWAISLPRSGQSNAKTLAQKGISGGVDCIQIDGNDVFAVYGAIKDAMANARMKNLPTVIECVTYRLSDHTTSDDASRYRDPKVLKEQKKKDPIIRFEKYILSKKILTEKEIEKIRKDSEKYIDKEVQVFEKIKPPEIKDIFNYTFDKMTDHLKEQMEEVIELDTERSNNG